MKGDEKNLSDLPEKQRWVKPTVKYVGHVGDVLKGGGGKLSPSASDTGDIRKPPGQA